MSESTVLLYTPSNFQGVITNTPSGLSYSVAPGQTISVSSLDVKALLARGFAIAPVAAGAGAAYAEMTINAGATNLVLTTEGDFYQVTAGWTSDIVPVGMDIDKTAGTITSKIAGTVQTLLQFSYTSTQGPDSLIVQIFKNGVGIPDHAANTWIDSTIYPNSVTVTGLDNIQIGDVFDVRVACTTDAAITIVPTYVNFNITAVTGGQASSSPSGTGNAILVEGGPGVKISDMATLANPPAAQGAMVAVAVPGDETQTYASPFATLLSGANAVGSSNAEGINITGGNSVDGNAGIINVTGGNASGSGGGGDIILTAGNSVANPGGAVLITAGDCTGSGGSGGYVVITTGNNDEATLEGGELQIVLGTGNPNGKITVNGGPTLMHASHSWSVGEALDGRTIHTADRPELVTSVLVRIDAANGTAATLQANRAASGTAFSAGDALTSTTADLTGAATDNQTLTLSSPSVTLAIGDSIGLVATGTLALSSGCITIGLTPQ